MKLKFQERIARFLQIAHLPTLCLDGDMAKPYPTPIDFYYRNGLSVSSLALAVSVCLLGVFIHRDIHQVAGICVFLDGIALLLVDVVLVPLWIFMEHSILTWKVAFGVKWLLYLALIGLSIWASVVMFIQT
jgi:hypothetical protein